MPGMRWLQVSTKRQANPRRLAISSAVEGDDPRVIDQLFEAPLPDGPRFVRLLIRRGTPDGLPRPTISPPDVKTRLMRHIGAA